MASQTAICNQALIQVGHDTLADVDDSTPRGRKLLAAWPIVLDALLAAHAWGFATRRVALQQSATVPVWGYDYAYQLPSDCLRLLEVYPDSAYQLESGQILSDEDEMSIKYVCRVTQTGLFSPLFALALADALAVQVCYGLEGSAQKRAALEKIAAKPTSRMVRRTWTIPGLPLGDRYQKPKF
jgi:hypothetical protein